MPKCRGTGCSNNASFGSDSYHPTHCWGCSKGVKGTKFIKSRTFRCGTSNCLRQAKYGPRGGVRKRCFEHRNKKTDVNQDSNICQYPECSKTKIKEYGKKFCDVHISGVLPESYLRLTRRISVVSRARGPRQPIKVRLGSVTDANLFAEVKRRSDQVAFRRKIAAEIGVDDSSESASHSEAEIDSQLQYLQDAIRNGQILPSSTQNLLGQLVSAVLSGVDLDIPWHQWKIHIQRASVSFRDLDTNQEKVIVSPDLQFRPL